MRHAIALIFALVASGCGAQGTPAPGTMVEVRLVDWTARNCYYMWPNGRTVPLQKANVEQNGLCPEYVVQPMVAE